MKHRPTIVHLAYIKGKKKCAENATRSAAWCGCGWQTPQLTPSECQRQADEHVRSSK